MKIVADCDIPYLQSYFDQEGDLIVKPGRLINAFDVKNADILLVRSVTMVNAALLAESSVKFVGSITAGADHLDKEWLRKSGIDWALASGFNAPPVADYVVSVLASLSLQGFSLKNKRAAIIGMGQVGRLVQLRLQSLGFEVICCDPLRALAEPGFVSTAFEEISDVDLITFHVPLTVDGPFPTYRMVNESFLKKQTSHCVLINASRGSVVDESALLTAGQHLTWCLDTWENEPLINKEVLLSAKIATPHMAGYSVQSKMRGIHLIYQALYERGYIKNRKAPLIMARHELTHLSQMSWQQIVLRLFDPAFVTQQMQQNQSEFPAYFDRLRQQFNDRCEFDYMTLGEQCPDAYLLAQLGFHLKQ